MVTEGGNSLADHIGEIEWVRSGSSEHAGSSLWAQANHVNLTFTNAEMLGNKIDKFLYFLKDS